MNPIKVLVLTGSESDLPSMEGCGQMLERFGIPYRQVVASAHRSPKKVVESVREAEEDGAEVVIAGAGMSAHLPGVVAAQTDLPVVGVPLPGGVLGGVDALLSIVQMPTGIPVATVAVGGAKNAAVLAARIISLKDPDVRMKLEAYREELARG